MKQYQDNGITLNIIGSWSEMSMRQYINLAKVQEKKESFLFDELYYIALIETLSNIQGEQLNDISRDTFYEIIGDLIWFNEAIEHRTNKTFIINGLEYAVINFAKITLAEEIMSKQILSKHQNNILDAYPELLAILIRPATKTIDVETKEEIYKLEKVDEKNIPFRANLILDQLKMVDVMQSLTFF